MAKEIGETDEYESLRRVAALIGEVSEAVESAETRADVERLVCDRLVADDTYALAWVGRVHMPSERVTVAAAAGEETGYLDDIDVTVDGAPTAGGPAGRAIARESLQVTDDVETEPEFEPWRDRALEHGFGSTAAVPISYAGTLYGVLVLYARERNAFDGAVRIVLPQLRVVTGQAINAVERKLALTSDRVVELSFAVNGDRPLLVAAAAELGGRYEFRGMSAVGDEYVRYVDVEGVDPERVAAFATDRGYAATVTRRDGDESLVELRRCDPVLDVSLAERGLVVRSFSASEEGGELVVEHPPLVDSRAAVEAVSALLPGAELTARHERDRTDEPDRRWGNGLSELTDRQRLVLETAVHAGYFEWPRASTAEEVADSLDISSATLHQHLRAAERKLFHSLLEREVPTYIGASANRLG